jgi:hypothetical protein
VAPLTRQEAEARRKAKLEEARAQHREREAAQTDRPRYATAGIPQLGAPAQSAAPAGGKVRRYQFQPRNTLPAGQRPAGMTKSGQVPDFKRLHREFYNDLKAKRASQRRDFDERKAVVHEFQLSHPGRRPDTSGGDRMLTEQRWPFTASRERAPGGAPPPPFHPQAGGGGAAG